MIHHLNGRLTEKSPTYAIIECNGVGYFLHISLITSQRIGDSENCKLLVHEVIREDAHELYGFAEESEREAFRRLISVSGVGASTARMILSSLSTEELVSVVMQKDVDAFKRIKGIGAKTAQRIIVDLHDKFPGEMGTLEKVVPGGNTLKTEALTALSSLGFDKTKANKTLDSILKTEADSISVEELIKLALKKL